MSFWNHVCIQSGHEARCSSRHVVNLVQTIVQIARFEVVRHARNLGSSTIPQVGVDMTQILHSFSKHGVSAIVEHNDPELLGWPVDFTGSSCSVYDNVYFFFAARNEYIDRWHILALQPQLRTVSPFQNEHIPQGLDEQGYGD
jgi:hypothetical protein